jgi:hypothetical protein
MGSGPVRPALDPMKQRMALAPTARDAHTFQNAFARRRTVLAERMAGFEPPPRRRQPEGIAEMRGDPSC